MATLVWDVLICPYCGEETALGIMSLVVHCSCGAWYEDRERGHPRRGWHNDLDEVRG